MKLKIDKGKFAFYVKLAVAFFLLSIIGSLIDDPVTFPKRVMNHFWLIVFLLPLNFILFEYTIPFIKLSWQRILAGLLFIWIHMMLYSFGLYGWRNLGIQLHIYFDLRHLLLCAPERPIQWLVYRHQTVLSAQHFYPRH